MTTPAISAATERPYLLERVGEAAVVQFYADGFEALPPATKRLAWHLYEAALAGRDIYYDQRYRHNLALRATLEGLVRHAAALPEASRDVIVRYAKLVWIHTGPYHSLTARKFVIELSREAFTTAAHAAAAAGARFPLRPAETIEDLVDRLAPVLFDAGFEPMVTSKMPAAGQDILTASANNLYDGVSLADLDGFTERYELNARLVKTDAGLVEEVYRIGGRYDAAIRRIVGHLEDAIALAPPAMADALRALARFYRTGEIEDRRAYDIAWVADRDSPVDTINGFIEVYLDARGCKGSWEAVVSYVNEDKTRQCQAIAAAAQWFEDRMPWDPKYRKPQVTGVSARAIDVVVEAGDAAPMTPIGINLPNDQAIREVHGSKSVSLSNIFEAYNKSTPASLREEFSWSPDEAARAERWGDFAAELSTNLHEIIGHGSGLVDPEVSEDLASRLREQYSTLEETRADLVALYFVADPQMVVLGLLEADDHRDIVLAEYEGYARNALVQLRRVREGTTLEEDHMRNRQAIVHWLMAHTSAIERRVRNGKTHYVMVDAVAFREGCGRMLAEVQRIKAQADHAAAAAMFEAYGTHFEASLRDEVLARTEALDLPAYTGFVQPELEPVRDAGGAIVDVRITYPCDFTAQMLRYADRYATLTA
ncbi:MAG: peptidase M49 [Vicinamibacteraceae bacterium]